MSAMSSITNDIHAKENAPVSSSSTGENMWSPPKAFNMYKNVDSSRKRKITFSTAHLAEVKRVTTSTTTSTGLVLPPQRDVSFVIPDLCKPGMPQEIMMIPAAELFQEKSEEPVLKPMKETTLTVASSTVAPSTVAPATVQQKTTPVEENMFYKPSSSRKRKITFSTAHLWEKKPCVASSSNCQEIVLPPIRDVVLDIPDMWKSAPRQDAAKEIPRIPTGKIHKRSPKKKWEDKWSKKNWSPRKSSNSYRNYRRH